MFKTAVNAILVRVRLLFLKHQARRLVVQRSRSRHNRVTARDISSFLTHALHVHNSSGDNAFRVEFLSLTYIHVLNSVRKTYEEIKLPTLQLISSLC
jgi:hypothetical protein